MNRMHANTAAMRHAQAPKHAQFQKGAVMVEFAFILPIFLLLLFGLVTFSIALYDKTVLCIASRQGARTGALYYASNYDSNGNLINANVQQRACDAANAVCQQDLINFGPNMNLQIQCQVLGGTVHGQRSVSVTTGIDYTGIYILSDVLHLSSTTIMRLEED